MLQTLMEERFHLKFPPGEAGRGGLWIQTAPPSFAALQEQLGLKSAVKKFAVEMFAINHVDKVPTAN